MDSKYYQEFRQLSLHEKMFVTGKFFVMVGGGLITVSKLLEHLAQGRTLIDDYSRDCYQLSMGLLRAFLSRLSKKIKLVFSS